LKLTQTHCLETGSNSLALKPLRLCGLDRQQQVFRICRE